MPTYAFHCSEPSPNASATLPPQLDLVPGYQSTSPQDRELYPTVYIYATCADTAIGMARNVNVALITAASADGSIYWEAMARIFKRHGVFCRFAPIITGNTDAWESTPRFRPRPKPKHQTTPHTTLLEVIRRVGDLPAIPPDTRNVADPAHGSLPRSRRPTVSSMFRPVPTTYRSPPGAKFQLEISIPPRPPLAPLPVTLDRSPLYPDADCPAHANPRHIPRHAPQLPFFERDFIAIDIAAESRQLPTTATVSLSARPTSNPPLLRMEHHEYGLSLYSAEYAYAVLGDALTELRHSLPYHVGYLPPISHALASALADSL